MKDYKRQGGETSKASGSTVILMTPALGSSLLFNYFSIGMTLTFVINICIFSSFRREVFRETTYDLYDVEYLPVNPNFYFDSADSGLDENVVSNLPIRIETSKCLSIGGDCVFGP